MRSYGQWASSVRAFGLLFLIAAASPALLAQDAADPEEAEFNKQMEKMCKWVKGPGNLPVGDIASIKVPKGFRGANAEDTKKLMEMMHNPVSGRELGLIGDDKLDWFFVFEFEECGYVKDDDKADLDADAMLESIKEGNDHGNEERRRRGWGTIDIIGWEQKPAYDEATQNLAWATRASSDGDEIINYNTRRLGRRGVMEITLVCDPELLPKALPEFKKIMNGYSFASGSRYGDFQSGDRIAAYGLTALVTGGVAAVALKTGILQKFGKLIIVAVIAVLAFIKKIFGAIGGAFRRQPAK